MKKSNYSSIESIISVAKKGGMFILVDDEKRENEGDLIISTTDSNAKNINFMAKYGRGLICLALDSIQAKKLNLSLMSPVNQSRNKTAFTISIEAKKGITTGISAKDRARTIKIASQKNVTKKDIVSDSSIFLVLAFTKNLRKILYCFCNFVKISSNSFFTSVANAADIIISDSDRIYFNCFKIMAINLTTSNLLLALLTLFDSLVEQSRYIN